jgi:DNA-binding response OmpR family regulator
MSRTVLIVEDDPGLLRMYHIAFALEGWTVLEASDGLHALRLLDASRPSVVVLDLMLPRISGQTVFAELRANSPEIAVLVVTGTSVSAAQFIPSKLLRKPVEPDALVRAADDALGSARSRPRVRKGHA